MTIIELDSCRSTNSELAARAATLPAGAIVTTRCQTAGRGQRGNSWEAEPGQNLTFSMLLRPEDFHAARQFELSEAVALGVADALRPLLPGHDVTVKWPNDVYVGDRKICGILIEHSLAGAMIGHTIAGVGINVNQREFLSDAPNPVSIVQLTGSPTPLRELLESVGEAIVRRLSQAPAACHADYLASLWHRRGGRYREAATGREFTADVVDVAPTGVLTLSAPGDPAGYLFKQVIQLI